MHEGAGRMGIAALIAALAGGAATAGAPSGPQVASKEFAPYPGEPGGATQTVRVRATTGSGGLRVFHLTSSAPQRDGAAGARSVTETADAPRLHTNNLLVDALFAQAVNEAKLDSVETISDPAYDGGLPIPCHCFQTGEKWPYVWTRDLSYALDLGLAGLDPARGAAGLEFKTGGFRPGVDPPPELPDGTLQIVQDTGSGGSWPVSTDRTAWALGAAAVLAELSGPDRAAFATHALAALSGTIETDRVAAYDPRDGLYGGEQSFLDWRAQSYAAWIPDHLSDMAQSKALSTNIVQYRAQRLAAVLEREAGDEAMAARYDAWADALAKAIDAKFWDPSAGLYATYTGPGLHAAPIAKYDALGNALAVVSGIATPARARAIVADYPFAPFGPPVLWPQAIGVQVYHNRAIWPFVTAYMLRAAAGTGNAAAADRALSSLMRGAALNLSNMENLEWLTGTATFRGGPAFDSRRQLWSVGGYYGAIVRTVFGWQPGIEGVVVAPFLTTATRALFGKGDSARIDGLSYQGRPVSILLHLPAPAAPGGVYGIGEVTLNGKAVMGRHMAHFAASGNLVEVRFTAPTGQQGDVSEIPPIAAGTTSDPRAFMPPAPVVAKAVRSASGVAIVIVPGAGAPGDARYTILRDGRVAQSDFSGGVWGDPHAPSDLLTACYAAIATDPATGLSSQPSLPVCVRGTLAQDVTITDPRVSADRGVIAPSDGVAEPTIPVSLGTHLFVRDVAITAPGTYAITLRYDNHLNDASTGITNAVKRLAMVDAQGGRQQAVIQMPEIFPVDGAHPLRTSTRALFRLLPGLYRIEISDFFNMSAIASNAGYGGAGGVSGPVNEARVATIRLDAVDAGE